MPPQAWGGEKEAGEAEGEKHIYAKNEEEGVPVILEEGLIINLKFLAWNKGDLKHSKERQTMELKQSWWITRESIIWAPTSVRIFHPQRACGNPPNGLIKNSGKMKRKECSWVEFFTTQAGFLAWYISDWNLAK